MKLNQIIAIVNGTKTETQRAITDIYKKIQSSDLLSGISRRYTPKDEEGEMLPSESKFIQVKADAAIEQAMTEWSKLWDLVATQDSANTLASADVIVDDNILLAGVNVLHLLFLEKQLTDVKTFINKLPVLDPSEKWTWDDNAGAYATKEYESTRTKKVPRNHVKAEATKEHPAQVEVYMEDVIVGMWTSIKHSGAIPVTRKKEYLTKVNKLIDAVKAAREEANLEEIQETKEGDVLMRYIFE